MRIKPMLGEYQIPGIQRIGTLEQRSVSESNVPGLAGNYHQDLGTLPVSLVIEGSLAGDEPRDGFLEAIREQYAAGEPLDFVSDITTATSIEQMLITSLQVEEIAGQANGFLYRLVLKQYIEPPQQASASGLDDTLGAEADALMDIDEVVDTLSGPDFGNPTPPLENTIDEFRGAMESLSGLGGAVTDLFGE